MKPRIRFTLSSQRWSRPVRNFEVTMPDGAQIWITTDGWKLLRFLIAQHRGGDMHYGIALGYA